MKRSPDTRTFTLHGMCLGADVTAFERHGMHVRRSIQFGDKLTVLKFDVEPL